MKTISATFRSMELNKQIVKARDAAALLSDDLLQAVKAVNNRGPANLGDRALLAYLNECLSAARALESKLLHL